MKITVTSARWMVAVVLVTVAEGRYDPKDGRHNIIMGSRNDNKDVLVVRDNPVIGSKWLPYPRVQSSDVCYPLPGAPPLHFTITSFEVIDQVGYGDGGFAFVTDGGVGYNRLCFHFKTQRGKGYNFIVNVWGRNQDNKSG